MPIVDLETVSIPPERQRKEFPELEEDKLVASILTKGLLHPPVVDKDNILLAGERRIRALRKIAAAGKEHMCNGKTLRPGLIFVTMIGDLNKLDRMEAELEENTIRVDLTWQEKAAATEALHKLRTAQAAAAGKVHTTKDLTIEVKGVTPAEVGPVNFSNRKKDVEHDLLVAAWGADEEVQNSATRKDALRVIERKLTAAHREALAREFLARKSDVEHEPIWGDCCDVLPTLPGGHYDCIIADPPYGINADRFANQAAVGHEYIDDVKTFIKVHEAIAKEGFRICKEKAHAYIFGDIRRFSSVCDIFKRAGWYVWPTPLIWYRGPNVGIAPRPEHGPRRTYEIITYCIKGDRTVTGLYADVLSIPHERGIERGAHKPAGLYGELIKRSCLPGNRVIDPCCGSGPIFPAATELKVVATGIEIDKSAFGLAVSRLKGEPIPEDGPDEPSSGSTSSLESARSDADEWEEV